ncbi:MAG TPA: LamG-like jellyroll fold domain-containing protein, partial [Puia sp.]
MRHLAWAFILIGLFVTSCKKVTPVVGGREDSLSNPENPPPHSHSSNNLADSNSVGSAEGLTNPLAAYFVRQQRQSLIIPSNQSLQVGASDLTICAWVKFNTIGRFNQVIAAKDNDSTVEGSDYWMGYNYVTQTLQFQVETRVVTRPAMAHTFGLPLTGQWLFVVGWYDHNLGTVHIQINNGTVDSAIAEKETRVTNTAFSIGSDVAAGGFLDGAINSVGLWKRVLTSEERATLFNLAFAAPAAPVGSGRNPGMIVNSARHSKDVPETLSGNIYSLEFNGVSEYLNLRRPVTLNPKGSALSVWFKTDSLSQLQVIAGRSTSASTYISILNSSTIRVQTDVAATYKDFTVDTLKSQTWYYLVFNRDAEGNSHVYLNGRESFSGAQPQPNYAISIDQLGRYWDGSKGDWYSGNLADLRLYKQSLSADDIKSISTGTEPVTNPA